MKNILKASLSSFGWVTFQFGLILGLVLYLSGRSHNLYERLFWFVFCMRGNSKSPISFDEFSGKEKLFEFFQFGIETWLNSKSQEIFFFKCFILLEAILMHAKKVIVISKLSKILIVYIMQTKFNSIGLLLNIDLFEFFYYGFNAFYWQER